MLSNSIDRTVLIRELVDRHGIERGSTYLCLQEDNLDKRDARQMKSKRSPATQLQNVTIVTSFPPLRFYRRNGSMVGHLRVPMCFYSKRFPYSTDLSPFDLFCTTKIKKNWPVIPLLAIQACAIAAAAFISTHTLFLTTIDVSFGKFYRFEIPTIPGFFDLRNPRHLKLMKLEELKPAIHLDNRYRLMRHEPMLDANGNETDDIGEDETAPGDLEEAFEKAVSEPYYRRRAF